MAWVRCQRGPVAGLFRPTLGSSRSRSRIRRWHSTVLTWEVLSLLTKTPAQHRVLTTLRAIPPASAWYLKHRYKGVIPNDPASVARLLQISYSVECTLQ
jgi:hypothetical protein